MSGVIIENDCLRVKTAPEKGAGIVCFYRKTGGRELAIMPDAESSEEAPEMASFLMVPYSNRIENGVFYFQGEKYELENGEEHALHGAVRFLPWQVIEQSATSVVMRFDSSLHQQVNWPWPFTSEVVYELQDDLFASSLKLTNNGATSMPGGMGWHPFLSRELTRTGEPLYLEINIPRVFPDDNDNRIPSGPSKPVPPELDFSREKLLDPFLFIDNCFIYEGGNGRLRWPESGVTALFQCSPECSHLVFYNPPAPFFALEPVTNANNGVNLFDRGGPDSGIVVLGPGEVLEASSSIRVRAS